ncbi:hypothetical protein SynSYN20_02033 [Synechococcus sp. SYN20]|nr:hypothetical protein SynSYN20_02033 [Synechococcus sp. SYN20]
MVIQQVTRRVLNTLPHTLDRSVGNESRQQLMCLVPNSAGPI